MARRFAPGIAVIGAGMASGPHFRALRDLGADVRWVVTRDEERAARAADSLPGARIAASVEDALSDPKVGTALILTPANTHLDMISRSAGAGKAVVVEKPLEISVERARQAIALCRRAAVPLAVVFQHRHRTVTPLLKDIIDRGGLGPIHAVEVQVPWWRDQGYYDEPGRGSYTRDGGGVLVTQAIHVLDLAMHLCGPVAAVSARTRTTACHRMDAEDLAVAAVEWGCGALGTILASTAHRPGFGDVIRVAGRDGTAVLEGCRLRVWDESGAVQEHGGTPGDRPPAHPMDFSHDDHRRFLAAALTSIAQGAAPAGFGTVEVLRPLELIEAMERSARLGRWIELGTPPAGRLAEIAPRNVMAGAEPQKQVSAPGGS